MDNCCIGRYMGRLIVHSKHDKASQPQNSSLRSEVIIFLLYNTCWHHYDATIHRKTNSNITISFSVNGYLLLLIIVTIVGIDNCECKKKHASR